MKQKDLIYPFPKEHRSPFIHDNVLVIQQWNIVEEERIFPDWEEILVKKPSLEFCSGNGDWILEQAAAHPEIQWVAVEMRFDRVRKIWSKAKNRGIDNLFIVHGKAQDLCRLFLSDACLRAVYVHFPDPWPKKRHHKNRLFQPEFIAELGRILMQEGELKVVSDDLPFLQASLENIQDSTEFKSLLKEPYYQQITVYGYSYFKELWEEKRREIYTLNYIKEKHNVAVSGNA
jgi:tRNA (guanine-N7-)-methyltransferase